MAITKVIAIRSKNGIKSSTKYITDEKKTKATIPDDEKIDKAQDEVSTEEKSDIADAIDYAINPQKTQTEELKLVSGHNCDPDMAAMEMQTLADYWKKERNITDNNKDAFHFIQSFDPRDNDKLTPELVHKIGLEFCEAIEQIDDKKKVHRNYKMLVATHTDKEHLHNHVICGAYDINTGAKYHDCKETYRQLQRVNDELCKKYNLSIILNPDNERSSSWYEAQKEKDNESWKEDFKKDIDAMKSVCRDWNTFVSYMEASGYTLRQGKYTTYSKDGKRVRDNKLGKPYTKESIEKYWKELDKPQEKAVEPQEEKYYQQPDKVNSITKKPYRVSIFDEYGKRRSILELILLLAKEVIKGEGDRYNKKTYPVGNRLYAKKDFKLQNMMDSISVARKENINSIEEIQDRLNETGKKLSHYKLELKKNNSLFNKMEVIKNAVDEYSQVRKTVESINELPDGPEKKAAQEKHKAEIEQYKKSKSILYKYNCASDEKIEDFKERYSKVEENISDLERMIKEESSEYKKFKRLQDNVELAQNKQYLYGPEYKEPTQVKEDVR